jgi:hypothetical protein
MVEQSPAAAPTAAGIFGRRSDLKKNALPTLTKPGVLRVSAGQG